MQNMPRPKACKHNDPPASPPQLVHDECHTLLHFLLVRVPCLLNIRLGHTMSTEKHIHLQEGDSTNTWSQIAAMTTVKQARKLEVSRACLSQRVVQCRCMTIRHNARLLGTCCNPRLHAHTLQLSTCQPLPTGQAFHNTRPLQQHTTPPSPLPNTPCALINPT